MTAALDLRQRRFLRKQTAISIAINAFIPTAVIWLIGVAPPDTLIGPRGLMPGMVLASGLATALMTVGLTLAVRASARSGKVEPLEPGGAMSIRTWLPNPLGVRAFALGLVAILAIVPCGIVVLNVFPILPLTPRGFIIWNLLYGAAVGLTMTPIAVRRALREPARD